MSVLKDCYTLLDGDPKNFLEQIIGGKFFDFINNSEIKYTRHSKKDAKITIKEEDKRMATEEEMQIMFDFALTLIRFAKANKFL